MRPVVVKGSPAAGGVEVDPLDVLAALTADDRDDLAGELIRRHRPMSPRMAAAIVRSLCSRDLASTLSAGRHGA